ncbi:MAG TPA: type II secretion system protein GspD, partial [Burkholderiaceae bacterium]
IYVVYLKNADAVRLAATLRAAMAANQLNTTPGTPGAAAGSVPQQSALGSNAVLGTNSSVAGANLLTLTQALATRNAAGVAGAITPGANLGIAGKIGGQYILGAIASFFDSDKDANVLSKPNLLTLDNEEAKIVIGQNVPFVTGQYASTSGSVGVNPFTTVERKDVGLTLRVRPTINENGTVKLTIFQETSTVDQNTVNNQNGPTTSKRSIESSVLVEDGGLVMLGGLLSDSYNNTVEKVPLAGDIPVLGNLFKSQARTRDKVNLMMFLRPAVMRDANATEAFAYDRYDEIRGLQIRTQPDTSNVMLRGVSGSNVLPELVPPSRPAAPISAAPSAPSTARSGTSFEGTQLIPPPQPAADSRRLAPSPLRGALPPTADPVSSRELP